MQRLGDPVLAQALDRLAAMLLAAAVGGSAWLCASQAPETVRVAIAVAGGAAGWLLGNAVLTRAGVDSPFALPDFAPVDFEPMESDLPVTDRSPAELPMTSENHASAEEDELLLVDVLGSVEPDSRVIRLFDPATLLSPGEPHAPSYRHDGPRELRDSTQELYAALAALRHSLR